MVPVRCLDIRPHHLVLDMCASPGSKTGQVLEALHGGGGGGGLPEGGVVACEPNLARATNLYGNIAEFKSPCLMVVSHPGQAFPDLTLADGKEVQYDHIVCDVPCSGDGTIRKNPNIWLDWHPARGNGRFNLQLNIARRGVELLKEGGTMAYSSCSINQIENEAVVAQLLREAGGSLQLEDMTARFPGLHWLPGLSSWRVFDSQSREYEAMEAVPDNLHTQIRPEMFPPSAAETKAFNLDRCMRFLPHLNDDGGFFVAVLKKTGPVKTTPKHKERSDRKESQRKKPKYSKAKLEHFIGSFDDFEFMNEAPDYHTEVRQSLEYLGVELPSSNLYKNKVCVNNVRLVSDSLRQLMHPGNNHLKVGSNPGVKILDRNSLSCKDKVPFHPNSAFNHVTSNLHSKRQVHGNIHDVQQLLNTPTISLTDVSDSLRSQLGELEPGLVIFSFQSEDERNVRLTCPGFFSRNKLVIHLERRAPSHYKFLLGLK